MTQYIDKSAVVAEIDKRIMKAPIDCYGHQRVWAYNDVKTILDTIEVKLADAHPRWISVEDDLPKMEHDFDTWSCSKEVLVFTSIGDYCIRRWEYDKRDDRFYWTPRTATVTHWMPMPQAPKKGDKNE